MCFLVAAEYTIHGPETNTNTFIHVICDFIYTSFLDI